MEFSSFELLLTLYTILNLPQKLEQNQMIIISIKEVFLHCQIISAWLIQISYLSVISHPNGDSIGRLPLAR